MSQSLFLLHIKQSQYPSAIKETELSMKLQRENTYTLPTLLFLLMLLSSTLTIAQEVEDEREFDYIEGSEKGPHKWGEIKEEWGACKHGDMQSPIDLSSERVKLITNYRQIIKINYTSSNATIINRGHDIAVYWKGNAGSIRVNGTQYFLQQCHWHSPSEHSINGRKYDLELHLVHLRPDPRGNKIVVVGAFYKIGRPNLFLSKLEEDIKHMVDEEEERVIGEADPSKILSIGKTYYRYKGSLTIPPCTEGVIWNLDRKIRTVSKAQVDLLREAVHDHAEMNARPRQPHNDREIHLHKILPIETK